MSFSDLLKMSLSSLWRRKLRTVLTVLGVVVGTASIMVMISLGLGLSKSNMEQIEQYGGLTTITVYPNENGGGMNYGGGGMAVSAESGSSGSAGNEPIRINDTMMETLASHGSRGARLPGSLHLSHCQVWKMGSLSEYSGYE